MPAEPEIVEDKEQSRYEARLDGDVVGVADYVGQEGLKSFTHTETFAGHKGQGIAGKIVERALADARTEGVEVLPFCPFVADYIGDHREYLELVPADRRTEFGLPAPQAADGTKTQP
jgi:predicted GNAT family acetyltransferase